MNISRHIFPPLISRKKPCQSTSGWFRRGIARSFPGTMATKSCQIFAVSFCFFFVIFFAISPWMMTINTQTNKQRDGVEIRPSRIMVWFDSWWEKEHCFFLFLLGARGITGLSFGCVNACEHAWAGAPGVNMLCEQANKCEHGVNRFTPMWTALQTFFISRGHTFITSQWNYSFPVMSSRVHVPTLGRSFPRFCAALGQDLIAQV